MKKFLFGFMAVAAVLLTVAFTFSSCKEESIEVKGEYGILSFEVTDHNLDATKVAQLKSLFAEKEREVNERVLPLEQAKAVVEVLAQTIGKQMEQMEGEPSDPDKFKFHMVLKSSVTGAEALRVTWQYENGKFKRI